MSYNILLISNQIFSSEVYGSPKLFPIKETMVQKRSIIKIIKLTVLLVMDCLVLFFQYASLQ